MEKMKWTRPETTGEMFEANEYVAACITGLIQCAYPGDGQTNGQIDKFDDYNGKKSGYWTNNKGMLHGLCGYDAKISFSEDTGSGFEYIGDKIQRNRPIYSIKNYSPAVGTYYNVTWNSDDGDNHSGTYSHTGRLKITNIEQGQTGAKLIAPTTSRHIFIIADKNYSHYHPVVDYLTFRGIRHYAIYTRQCMENYRFYP